MRSECSQVLAKAVLAQDTDSESWVRLCQAAGQGVVGLANHDLSLSVWAAMLMLLRALTLERHYAAFSARRFATCPRISSAAIR